MSDTVKPILTTEPLVASLESRRVDGFPVVRIDARHPQTGATESIHLLLAHREYAAALVAAINTAKVDEMKRLAAEVAFERLD
jgi:hypothetical protein